MTALSILSTHLQRQGVRTRIHAADDSMLDSVRAWVRKNTVSGVKLFRSLTTVLRKHPKTVRTVFVLTALSVLIVRVGAKTIARWRAEDAIKAADLENAKAVFARYARNPTWYGDMPAATSVMATRAGKILDVASAAS